MSVRGRSLRYKCFGCVTLDCFNAEVEFSPNVIGEENFLVLGFGLVKNEADIDPAAMQLFKQNGVCTKLNDLARVRGSVSGLDLQRNVRTVFKFQYSVADAMKGRIRRIEGDFRFQSVRPPDVSLVRSLRLSSCSIL